MIKALDDPSCRELDNGLLPSLLPILINRALSVAADCHQQQDVGCSAEARSLALDLLLAASRNARPSALRPALAQLAQAGLQTKASLWPARVVAVMRPSCSPPPPQPVPVAAVLKGQTGGIAIGQQPQIASKEVQMAEVLRLVSFIF